MTLRGLGPMATGCLAEFTKGLRFATWVLTAFTALLALTTVRQIILALNVR